MGRRRRRFVAKAEAGEGWRIWDTLQERWWGERYWTLPDRLIAELNGDKRPDQIAALIKYAARNRVRPPHR
jgi:hypothetical protein